MGPTNSASHFRPYKHSCSLFRFRFAHASLLSLGLLSLGVTAAGEQAKPPAVPDGVLKYLGRLVGGEWVTSAKLPSGAPEARFIWTSEHQGQLLRGKGNIASTPVETLFGWDPVAGKTYYLDRRSPDTLYFGHARLAGEEIRIEFQSLVGEPSHWNSRERFTGPVSYQAITTPLGGREGKDSQKLTLLRRPQAEPQPAPRAEAELEKLQTNLSRLALLIGGTWQSEATDTSGQPVVTLRYTWGPGRKTLLGTGTRNGTPVESVIGWDPAAGKLYSLELHGPETLYFGHYTVHDEDITLDFRSLVGLPAQFRANAWFPDSNTYMALVRPLKEGRVGEGRKVKLLRKDGR